MTVDEFLAWAVRQDKGRYELFDGRVVMQQPQNWGHAELCVGIYNALAAAIDVSGVPFYAAPVGMTVRITKKNAFEPDALVAPLPKPERLDLEIRDPVVVVEVLSRSTAKRDRRQLPATSRCRDPHYLSSTPKRPRSPGIGATGRAIQPPVVVREGSLTLDPRHRAGGRRNLSTA
jgi:hypothetical protein